MKMRPWVDQSQATGSEGCSSSTLGTVDPQTLAPSVLEVTLVRMNYQPTEGLSSEVLTAGPPSWHLTTQDPPTPPPHMSPLSSIRNSEAGAHCQSYTHPRPQGHPLSLWLHTPSPQGSPSPLGSRANTSYVHLSLHSQATSLCQPPASLMPYGSRLVMKHDPPTPTMTSNLGSPPNSRQAPQGQRVCGVPSPDSVHCDPHTELPTLPPSGTAILLLTQGHKLRYYTLFTTRIWSHFPYSSRPTCILFKN